SACWTLLKQSVWAPHSPAGTLHNNPGFAELSLENGALKVTSPPKVATQGTARSADWSGLDIAMLSTSRQLHPEGDLMSRMLNRREFIVASSALTAAAIAGWAADAPIKLA